jgi:DNA repair protein RecO
MKTMHGRGIILSRRSFLEHDVLLEIFSESEGRICLLSKGIKKIKSKQCGILTTFTIIEYERFLPISEKSIPRLIRASQALDFLRPKELPSLLFAYSVASEITLKFSREGHSQPKIFSLWKEFLLEENEDPMCLFGFLCRFFSELGMFPDFSVLKKETNKTEEFFWNFSSGIFSKENPPCEILDIPLIKTFSFCSRSPLSESKKITPTTQQQKRLFHIIGEFMNTHIPFPLRSWMVYQYAVLGKEASDSF